MNNSAIDDITWDELERQLLTPEEIAASNLRVKAIGEQIRARDMIPSETD